MSSSLKPSEPNRRFWSSRRVIGTFIVLSLIAAFGVSSCNSSDEQRTSGPTAGGPASTPTPKTVATPVALAKLPDSVLDAQLTSVDGAAFKLSDYSDKVLLVNLWATWCGPCRQETPELVKLYKEFKSKGLEIVGLTTENPELTESTVKAFMHSNGVNYRVGWASNEFAWSLMQGRDVIPQSFIIARDGRIVKRFIGFSLTQTAPQLREAVEAALNDKTKA